MPRNLTLKEELIENIRIIRGVLGEQRWWCEQANVDNYVDKQRRVIDEAEAKIIEAEAKSDDAPKKVEGLRRALVRARRRLSDHENRHTIDRFLHLAAETSRLEGLLEDTKSTRERKETERLDRADDDEADDDDKED